MLATLLLGFAPLRAEPTGPERQFAALPQARLAGAMKYTWWGFEVYRAQLWVEPGFERQDPWRSRFALELQYLRDFKGRDIAQRSLQEMRRQGALDDTLAQSWLQTMQSVFTDVGNGDRLTGIFVPGQGARFLVNGRALAEVNDTEFAQRFFGIWLSEKTSEPKLRMALLGAGQP